MSTLTVAPGAWRGNCDPSEIAIPRLAQLARRAVPQVVEGVLIPLWLFLITFDLAGIAPAIVVGLGAESVAIGRRLLQRRRIPGIMIVGAVTLTIRSALGLATGSAFVYFVQPIFGNVCLAAMFLLSVAAGRPLARRFAADYCDIPRRVRADACIHSFFQRCSMMWAAVGFANAGITLWLLLSQPTTIFLLAKSALSISLTVAAVGVSVIWFRRTVTRYGLIAAV